MEFVIVKSGKVLNNKEKKRVKFLEMMECEVRVEEENGRFLGFLKVSL